MQDTLLSTINRICDDNKLIFSFRHDRVSNIFHFIFTKECKSVKFSINYFIMLYQPEWITIRDIELRVGELLKETARNSQVLL